MERIVKTIKDNCYKEAVGSGRDEEIRYFMTETDIVELAEELVKNHGVSHPDSDQRELLLDFMQFFYTPRRK